MRQLSKVEACPVLSNNGKYNVNSKKKSVEFVYISNWECIDIIKYHKTK